MHGMAPGIQTISNRMLVQRAPAIVYVVSDKETGVLWNERISPDEHFQQIQMAIIYDKILIATNGARTSECKRAIANLYWDCAVSQPTFESPMLWYIVSFLLFTFVTTFTFAVVVIVFFLFIWITQSCKHQNNKERGLEHPAQWSLQICILAQNAKHLFHFI